MNEVVEKEMTEIKRSEQDWHTHTNMNFIYYGMVLSVLYNMYTTAELHTIVYYRREVKKTLTHAYNNNTSLKKNNERMRMLSALYDTLLFS